MKTPPWISFTSWTLMKNAEMQRKWYDLGEIMFVSIAMAQKVEILQYLGIGNLPSIEQVQSDKTGINRSIVEMIWRKQSPQVLFTVIEQAINYFNKEENP